LFELLDEILYVSVTYNFYYILRLHHIHATDMDTIMLSSGV